MNTKNKFYTIEEGNLDEAKYNNINIYLHVKGFDISHM